MNLKDLEKIIKLVEGSNINQLKLEEDGIAIEITKEGRLTAVAYPPPMTIQPARANPSLADDNEITITSPMVGAFYAASSPDTPNFVEVGGHVKKGDTVCIIEAMKLFNEIESEFDGTVVRVLAKNEDTVEFGQPLIILKKDA